MKRQAEGKKGRKSGNADLILIDCDDDDDDVVYVKTVKSPEAASAPNHTPAMTTSAPASQMVLHHVSMHFLNFKLMPSSIFKFAHLLL